MASPALSDLPALRTTSDHAWGFWYRTHRGNLGSINKIMSTMIFNAITPSIIEHSLATFPLAPGEARPNRVLSWPGTTFLSTKEQGDALIGRYQVAFVDLHRPNPTLNLIPNSALPDSALSADSALQSYQERTRSFGRYMQRCSHIWDETWVCSLHDLAGPLTFDVIKIPSSLPPPLPTPTPSPRPNLHHHLPLLSSPVTHIPTY